MQSNIYRPFDFLRLFYARIHNTHCYWGVVKGGYQYENTWNKNDKYEIREIRSAKYEKREIDIYQFQ